MELTVVLVESVEMVVLQQLGLRALAEKVAKAASVVLVVLAHSVVLAGMQELVVTVVLAALVLTQLQVPMVKVEQVAMPVMAAKAV